MITLLLLLQAAASSGPTWTPPPWVTIIGFGLTWLGGLILVLRFKMDVEKHKVEAERMKKERDTELADMARRVCKEFTSSKEYRQEKEERMRELAQDEVDDAFTRRAQSFVSAERFDERMRATEQRLGSMETALKDNTEKIGNMSGQITQAVTTQLTAFLSSRIFGPKE